MSAYYNEIDGYAAEWLRDLIAAGLIAPGDVDTRSIVDVKPDDLTGYAQCHFFAGIGGWSYAARLAGWPDDRPLWTGSCPCQPFSVAGRGKGIADERHLWPDFHRLIRGSRPAVVMGEQTSGAPGYAWLDGVGSDLETEAYTWRAVDIPACSVNAPEIRNRLYWVACTGRIERAGRRISGDVARPPRTTESGEQERERMRHSAGDGGSPVWLDRPASARHGQAGPEALAAVRDGAWRRESERRGSDGGLGGLGSAGSPNAEGWLDVDDRADARWQEAASGPKLAGAGAGEFGGLGSADESGCLGSRVPILERRPDQASAVHPGPGPRGFWDDWELIGPDPEGKYRRIKPGITPLDTRLPGHVGQIRGYGNAINPELAAEVIRAYMEAAT